jgi:acetyl-CoA carboxylase biotin carboxylase subunit
VTAPGGFSAAFTEASLEAEKAFGNPGLYVEKFLAAARHIEFQILVDAYGNAIHLGERECSIQRSHQKLVEESPSPAIREEVRRELGARAARSAAAIGYVNAGTMEFLLDPEGHLYFMEMNTRIQVEHPVTEMVTGMDLVREQIAIAANVPLARRQEDVSWSGHAIEARINAENPRDGFRPDPGTITGFTPPASSPAVRLDTHIQPGYRIPPYYDSMLAKLIAHAPTRDEARAVLGRALGELRIEGVHTTIPFHQLVVEDPDFAAGRYDTRFVERILPRLAGGGEHHG